MWGTYTFVSRRTRVVTSVVVDAVNASGSTDTGVDVDVDGSVIQTNATEYH